MRTPKLTILAVGLPLVVGFLIFSALRFGPVTTASAAGDFGDNRGCGAVGTYGYTGFGNIFLPNGLGYPAGIASTNGTITLDGNGNWVVHEFEIGDGQVINPAATFGGTYTLNSDCIFTGNIPGLGPALVGVVVDNGNQIRAMTTIPGVQINFISTIKVRPREDSR